jgi:hypothetical protein
MFIGTALVLVAHVVASAAGQEPPLAPPPPTSPSYLFDSVEISPPSPPPSPPPTPPLVPPVPPGVPGASVQDAVSFHVVIAGDISSFGVYQQQWYKMALARTVYGVRAQDIELSVSAASLSVTAVIATADTAELLSELTALVGHSTLPAMSAALGVTLERVDTPELVQAMVVVPSSSMDREAYTEEQASIRGVVIAVFGVIMLGALLYGAACKRGSKDTERQTRPNTSVMATTASALAEDPGVQAQRL